MPTTSKPRAALYLRVSTADQSVENQREELEQLAEARGYEPQAYVETESAAKARPVLERMLEDARAGRVRAVLVWSLDRLHRSMKGSIDTVLELDSIGVRVISLRESWLDTSGPVRSLLVAIFGWVAEQERIRIGERTRAGLAQAKRKGKRLGRPKKELDPQKVAYVVKTSGKRFAARSFGVHRDVIDRMLEEAAANSSPVLAELELEVASLRAYATTELRELWDADSPLPAPRKREDLIQGIARRRVAGKGSPSEPAPA